MAKPDCDDGWFKMSVELEAALAFAGFTETARTVLRYVFLQIFGKGVRRRHAYLPQKFISERVGEKKQNVHRALRELVESGVLVEVRDDQYRFVKDYEKWVSWNRDPAKCGGPRLKPQQIKDCKAAPAYARSFEIDPKDDCVSSNGITESSNGITESSNGITRQSSNGITPVIQRDDQSNPVGLPNPAGAIEDRARVRRERERERNTPLPPKGGEREEGRLSRGGKAQQYQRDRESQIEAIRIRRAAEAGKESNRGQA